MIEVTQKDREDFLKLAALKEGIEKYERENKIESFYMGSHVIQPNPAQAELLDAWNNPLYKVFTFTGANQIGKTTIGMVIALSVVLGRWPWNNQPIPGLSISRYRKVRYVGQGWETHIKAVLIPKLEEWWPKSRGVVTRRNNQGVDYIWREEKTSSAIELMSNSQDSDVFEGWEGDLVVYDEPPTREIRVACARGLIARRGRELFCATLLKEAWIHREVIKALDPVTHQPDKSIYNINVAIENNIGFGLTKEGRDQFEKTLKPEEKEARLLGKPSYLTSLVCPRFSRLLHIKEPFKVPLDWMVDVAIDFHPSKPWAVVFMATARNNFKYVVAEIQQRGNPEYIVDEIMRIAKNNVFRMNKAIIDPLAKGDENNDETVFKRMENRFASYGIALDLASKDKEGGIAILNSWIWTENEMPGLQIFRDCPFSITQLEDWMYDPETGKPAKENDDFCECIYRLTLLNTEWYDEHAFERSETVSAIL